MTLQQSTYSHPIIKFAREKFYELATKKHVDALNPEF
ncbi:unnamed protein product, partial [Rotaria sordida]